MRYKGEMLQPLTRFRQLIEDLLYVSNSNSHILVLQNLLTVINGVLLKCKNCNNFFNEKFRGARKVFWPHTGGRKPLECNRYCEQKKLQHPAITVYSEFIVS